MTQRTHDVVEPRGHGRRRPEHADGGLECLGEDVFFGVVEGDNEVAHVPLGVAQGVGHSARARDVGEGRAGLDKVAFAKHCPHGLDGLAMLSVGRLCALRRLATAGSCHVSDKRPVGPKAGTAGPYLVAHVEHDVREGLEASLGAQLADAGVRELVNRVIGNSLVQQTAQALETGRVQQVALEIG